MSNEVEQTQAFEKLTPDNILDAVETVGIQCDGRFLALNSYENRVYQIGVVDDDPIVAKFYRPRRWSDEAIIEEHDFTLQLAELEIPVVAPLLFGSGLDSSGKSLFHSDLYRFALYPRKGGRSPDLDNAEHLESLGRFIGRIHALGASKKFQHRLTLNIENTVIEPRQYLLDTGLIPDHLLPAYESITNDLVRQIKTCYERAGSVNNIRLHGDCHPSNILWADDMPHIVDFDDARTGPAVQDIWMFLSGERDYMSARLADFLEGYTQFYDFNAAELHLVEALRTMRIIHYAYWIALRWNDPAFPIAFPWFNSTRYWEDHVLSLREQSALLNEPPLIWS